MLAILRSAILDPAWVAPAANAGASHVAEPHSRVARGCAAFADTA